MLTTLNKLKCNAGKSLPKIYFQFPKSESPGDLDALSKEQISFLKDGTLAHLIFVKILPNIAGFLTFLFFVTSASFCLYSYARHIYIDLLIVKKTRLLKKLGKHPVGKRRKRYRTTRKKSEADSVSLSQKSMGSSKSYGNLLRVEDMPYPYYFDDLPPSPSGSENEANTGGQKRHSLRPREIISLTSPPMKVNPNELPRVPKPIEIPGEPFPTLPDAPAITINDRGQPGKQHINTKGPNELLVVPKTNEIPKEPFPTLPDYPDASVKNDDNRQSVKQQINTGPNRNVKFPARPLQAAKDPLNDTKSSVSLNRLPLKDLRKKSVTIKTHENKEPVVSHWNSSFELEDKNELSEASKELDSLTEQRKKLRERWAQPKPE